MNCDKLIEDFLKLEPLRGNTHSQRGNTHSQVTSGIGINSIELIFKNFSVIFIEQTSSVGWITMTTTNHLQFSYFFRIRGEEGKSYIIQEETWKKVSDYYHHRLEGISLNKFANEIRQEMRRLKLLDINDRLFSNII